MSQVLSGVSVGMFHQLLWWSRNSLPTKHSNVKLRLLFLPCFFAGWTQLKWSLFRLAGSLATTGWWRQSKERGCHNLILFESITSPKFSSLFPWKKRKETTTHFETFVGGAVQCCRGRCFVLRAEKKLSGRHWRRLRVIGYRGSMKGPTIGP